MKTKFFLLFLSLISFSPLFSRSNFQFRHFTVEDGLTSNCVRAIVQDQTGFLWFGTDEGLIRYDGKKTRAFRCNRLDQKKLGTNSVLSLLDNGDDLWIGTDRGAYIYDYKQSIFRFFEVKTKKGVLIESGVNNIVKDNNQNLWFSTNGQGVFRYNLKTKELLQYDFCDTSGIVPFVFVDKNQKVWAITSNTNEVLFLLNNITNELEAFELKRTGEDVFRPKSLVLYEDSFENLWLGTWDKGILKVDKETGKVEAFLDPDLNGILHIHSILEYKPGLLLIGSDDGLSLFDIKSKEHTLYTYDETSSKSLSNQFVYPIIKDHEGGIWIGTYYGGANYVSPLSNQFKNYSNSKFYNSVAGNIVGRFCEDDEGNIWVATDDGGLSCFLPAEEKFINYIAKEKSLSYHNLHALCLDNEDLWIGTYTGGLNILNLKTKEFRYYTSDPNDPKTLDGSSIYAIHKDTDEDIWVATMSGINLYNRKEGTFKRVRTLGVLTMDILQDKNENLWFATHGNGVYKYNKKKDYWVNYNIKGSSKFLASDHVNSLCLDSENRLWVGTMEGLCVYDEEQDAFIKVNLDGIYSNNICGIVETDGVYWLTTSKGLVCYSEGKIKQIFTSKDGLQSDFFLPNSILKTSGGDIFVGSVKGFSVFNPKDVVTNTVVPPVVITSMEIYNEEVLTGSEVLPSSIEYLNSIKLSYKQNVLSFNFASLSFCVSEKNEYAYKLEGFDERWNYISAQEKAVYTKLPPGKYIFKVKASNNDKVWNENEVVLNIVITPPFYLTLPFKVVYLILFLIFIAFIFRFFFRKKEKKYKQEIQRIKEEQEKEAYQSKIDFFTMIAHEIRTPVSLIVGPLEELLDTTYPLPDWILSSLNIMSKNSSRILHLINQLLDFRKIEEQGINYKLKAYSISEIIKEVFDYFDPIAKEADLDLIVEYPNGNIITEIDKDAFVKVISNLLTNAIKYARTRIIVRLQIDKENNLYSISVLDDGPGINNEEKELIFEPFYQASDHKAGTGVGLSIVKKIVEGHNGTIKIETDRSGLTHFCIELPIVFSNDMNFVLDEQSIDASDVTVENIMTHEKSLQAASVNKKLTLLLVDDDVDMLSFLSQFLERKNYNVIKANDGEDGLKKLEENEIDFIISDLMMPRMDGLEFCKYVRTNTLYSHLPFVLLTAKADLNSRIDGLGSGADAYIEKPFSVNYLGTVIDNLLFIRGLLQDQYSKMPLVSLNTLSSNQEDKDFLDKLSNLIEQNFSNPELNVDFLAHSLHVSRSGLFAKIKSLVDVTPNELIQIVRLKKAASLLLQKKYKINEVCYMIGFNNPSYFSKCFQKQFGVLPSEFVNQLENKD